MPSTPPIPYPKAAMRILHFSDLHIGVENYGRVDPQTGLSTRLLDFLRVLDDLVDYALTDGVDLVLFAGDAYKSRDPSQTHQRELAQRIARLTTAGIPVFLLVGNHDLPHALGRATAVEIYHTLQVPSVYVGDSLQTYQVQTRSGPLQVVALPWPNRSKLLTREESRGMNIEQIRQEIQERLTRSVTQQAERLDPTIPAVLAGHVTINGAKTGSEQSMMLGRDHVLLLSSIHLPQLDYVALGHIHKHQVLRENPMVVYAGSLQRVDFSEEKDTKGFCVIDLDPSRSRSGRLTSFHFQAVDARPFLTIDIEVKPGDANPTETVLQAIARRNVAETIVRVRIQLPGELEAALNEEQVRNALSDAHYVAAISTEVARERRTRVSSSAVETLSPTEALRLYFQSRNMSGERLQRLMTYAQQLMETESAEE